MDPVDHLVRMELQEQVEPLAHRVLLDLAVLLVEQELLAQLVLDFLELQVQTALLGRPEQPVLQALALVKTTPMFCLATALRRREHQLLRFARPRRLAEFTFASKTLLFSNVVVRLPA